MKRTYIILSSLISDNNGNNRVLNKSRQPVKFRLRVCPPFFLRDSRVSEMRACMTISPCEKRQHTAGREKNEGHLIFLFPRCMSPFLVWGDFHARSRFARSTIPEEKWGTTRSLISCELATSFSLEITPQKPKFNDGCVLFKHLNFCSIMHS